MAIEEVRSNPRASIAMREFASIRLQDAEVGCRKVMLRYGLTAPIPISWMDLGEEKELKGFPWIKLSSWVRHLMDTGVLHRQMVGVSSLAKMQGVLSEFWKRYKVVEPNHPVFQLEAAGVLKCERLIPYYSHSDEGRTFRDAALWVFNVHGVIGRGTLSYSLASMWHLFGETNKG